MGNVRGTPYWMFRLPPPDLPPDLPPIMFRRTFRQPHWHLTSLGVPPHLTTPCGTSPASIWPSDLPRSFRSRNTIPPLVPSSPIMPCPTAAPHASPPPSSAALLHCCSIHSDPLSFPTFFPHSAMLVHHVTCALHIFSDLGLISIISAILYISLHQQVDPYPFLFGSPARCASCLVYFLHNKLNTLDPLLVPHSARIAVALTDSGGLHQTLYSILMLFYKFYLVQSGGVHWTPSEKESSSLS